MSWSEKLSSLGRADRQAAQCCSEAIEPPSHPSGKSEEINFAILRAILSMKCLNWEVVIISDCQLPRCSSLPVHAMALLRCHVHASTPNSSIHHHQGAFCKHVTPNCTPQLLILSWPALSSLRAPRRHSHTSRPHTSKVSKLSR